jgi:hypothetical protein
MFCQVFSREITAMPRQDNFVKSFIEIISSLYDPYHGKKNKHDLKLLQFNHEVAMTMLPLLMVRWSLISWGRSVWNQLGTGSFPVLTGKLTL